jgi:hypothetical protein
MTRRRKTKSYRKVSNKPTAKLEASAPITFRVALAYLWDVIKWYFSKREYINRRIYIAGKMRPIIAEKYGVYFVKGLSHAISKRDCYQILQ